MDYPLNRTEMGIFDNGYVILNLSTINHQHYQFNNNQSDTSTNSQLQQRTNGTDHVPTTLPDCTMYPNVMLETQFWMVSVFGTGLALFSLFMNLTLVILFASRPNFQSKHYLYLFGLAVMDTVQTITFILVLSAAIAFEYLHSIPMMRAWYAYIIPMFCLAHVCRLAGVILLIAVSIERFLTANMLSGCCTVYKRVICKVALVFAGLMRGTMLIEIDVLYRANCTGMAEYILMPSSFSMSKFGRIWVFWVRTIVTVLIPFFLLLTVQFAIVYRDQCHCIQIEPPALRYHLIGSGKTTQQISKDFSRARMRIKFKRQSLVKTNLLSSSSTARTSSSKTVSVSRKSSDHETTMGMGRDHSQRRGGTTITNGWVARARAKVQRAATRTLIALIFGYLMGNLLNIFVCLWEYVDQQSLYQNHYKFYTVASDIVSLSNLLVSAFRLPTYAICDLKFREVLVNIFCSKKFKQRRRQLRKAKLKEQAQKIRSRVVRERNVSMSIGSVNGFNNNGMLSRNTHSGSALLTNNRSGIRHFSGFKSPNGEQSSIMTKRSNTTTKKCLDFTDIVRMAMEDSQRHKEGESLLLSSISQESSNIGATTSSRSTTTTTTGGSRNTSISTAPSTTRNQADSVDLLNDILCIWPAVDISNDQRRQAIPNSDNDSVQLIAGIGGSGRQESDSSGIASDVEDGMEYCDQTSFL